MNQPPTIKRMEKEFDDLPYRYAHSGQPNHEVLKKWFSSYLSEVLEYLRLENKSFVGVEGIAGLVRVKSYNQAVSELNTKIKKLQGGK